MALEPLNEAHAAQILAGIEGRLAGHRLEESLTAQINELGKRPLRVVNPTGHHADGSPAAALLNYIASFRKSSEIRQARAAWLGGLATGSGGNSVVEFLPGQIRRSKSDVVIELTFDSGVEVVGVSVKTCQKKTPTNAQIYFTTAEAFSDRVVTTGIPVSDDARSAMRMFCGDIGFRPQDLGEKTSSRDRYYWEELPRLGRGDWEELLTNYQDDITEILIRTAYPDDPIPPSFILHQRTRSDSLLDVPVALFEIGEFLQKSRLYASFETRKYRVLKGSSRDPNTWHDAPRFGVVQFQRGGQKQHPTQLQFNLKAGYFNETLFVDF